MQEAIDKNDQELFPNWKQVFYCRRLTEREFNVVDEKVRNKVKEHKAKVVADYDFFNWWWDNGGRENEQEYFAALEIFEKYIETYWSSRP